MTNKVYIVEHDGGCEGYSGPIQAFNSFQEARAAVALGDSLVVFEVPFWPEQAPEWFEVKPIK